VHQEHGRAALLALQHVRVVHRLLGCLVAGSLSVHACLLIAWRSIIGQRHLQQRGATLAQERAAAVPSVAAHTHGSEDAVQYWKGACKQEKQGTAPFLSRVVIPGQFLLCGAHACRCCCAVAASWSRQGPLSPTVRLMYY
jgi:hypothetical protein